MKIYFGLYLQAEGYACVGMLDMHRKSTLFSDKMSSFNVLVFCSRIKTWASNSKPSHGLLIGSSFVIENQNVVHNRPQVPAICSFFFSVKMHPFQTRMNLFKILEKNERNGSLSVWTDGSHDDWVFRWIFEQLYHLYRRQMIGSEIFFKDLKGWEEFLKPLKSQARHRTRVDLHFLCQHGEFNTCPLSDPCIHVALRSQVQLKCM